MTDPLSYPAVLPPDDLNDLCGHLVYAVKRYPLDGVSFVMSAKDGGGIEMRTADWDGHLIKRGDDCLESALRDSLGPLGEIFLYAHMQTAQFYFSRTDEGPLLVDVRSYRNEFIGPGFLEDLFGQTVKTQNIGKPTVCTPDFLQSALKGGDVLLKTSVFKTTVRNGIIYPLYGRTWQ